MRTEWREKNRELEIEEREDSIERLLKAVSCDGDWSLALTRKTREAIRAFGVGDCLSEDVSGDLGCDMTRHLSAARP
jgi:hypothetical protein